MTEKFRPNQWDSMRKMADLGESMEPTEEVNLTWEQLASTLGVQPNAEGNLDSIELINACLGVQSNEAVNSLPKADRLRVIRSAAGAIDHLMGGRGR